MTIRQGKGKKDRVIPIGDRAAAWVEKYVREVRPQLVVEPDDHTVFLSNAGEPFCLDHLSNLVRDYVDKAEYRQARRLPPVPPLDGDLDAGKRRRHPLHPADARACGSEHNSDLHARIDPEAEADPHGDAPGQAGAQISSATKEIPMPTVSSLAADSGR